MNTQYLPSFTKDIKALKSTPYFETIKAVAFDEIPNAVSFEEIINIKKLYIYKVKLAERELLILILLNMLLQSESLTN